MTGPQGEGYRTWGQISLEEKAQDTDKGQSRSTPARGRAGEANSKGTTWRRNRTRGTVLFVQHCREKPHVLLCLSNVVWPTYLRDFGYQGRKKWHSMSPGLHPSEADRQVHRVGSTGRCCASASIQSCSHGITWNSLDRAHAGPFFKSARAERVFPPDSPRAVSSVY